MLDEKTHVSMLPTAGRITRRQVLRALAAAGTASFVGGTVLTACNDAAPPTSNVVLFTDGWPFMALPSAEEQKSDIYKKSFAVSYQNWLNRNPGVTLKSMPGISDATKRKAAIASNAAPSWYGDLGDTSTDRFAYSLGYAAETTDLIQQYKVDTLLADYALPRWHAQWNLNGHYYGLPGDTLLTSNGLFYRRDLIQEAGLIEPKQGWSWDDFRALARGLTGDGPPTVPAPNYLIGYLVNSNLLENLAMVPSANSLWHYQRKYTPFLDEWVQRVELYRSMYFDDKSIEQSSKFNEYTTTLAFSQGRYKLAPTVGLFYTVGYAGIASMPNTFGKRLDDLVGFVPYPFGSNGAFSIDTSSFGAVLLNPHLSTNALAKAADLWFYMFYGQGYIDQRAMRYEVTKDPRVAYDYITPGNRFQKNPNIPVTVQDAWGERFVQAWMDCINIPVIPDPGLYYPPETGTVPPTIQQQHEDALVALTTTQQDIPTILNTLQSQYNAQAASMRSSIDSGQFKQSSQQYYGALDTFWQANSPHFYQNDWNTFYHNEVLPGLA